ncbi:MAG: phage portal protein [Planctomycetaceae bacterium]|nr:phage portal protein [Planctomycetaceae bacterium]
MLKTLKRLLSRKSKQESQSKESGLAKLRRGAYDMATDSPRKGAVYVSTASEDRELLPWERQTAISNVRNLRRNFPLVDFVIEKHCQYNAVFSMQPLTSDREFNRLLTRKLAEWKHRKNCDITGRYSFDEMMNLAVSHAVSDGDVGIVYHDGGKLQLIESERIRNPDDEPLNSEHWTHGVKTGKYRVSYYCIHKRRLTGGFEQERIIPADNLWLPGFRKRIDQLRGVSPFSPSVDTFQHIYECCEFALAKVKLEQFIGLVHKVDDDALKKYRDAIEKDMEEKYGQGIANFTIGHQDSVDMLTANNPSNQFQDFIETMIRMAFACLGLPLSFWKGSDTNYYGSEGECEQYIDWCQKRQVQWLEMLTEITRRLIADWVLNDELELPKGWKVEDVEFEWLGASIPWFRLVKNIKDFVTSIQGGFMNPQDVCKMFSLDYIDNAEQIRDAKALNKEIGITPLWEQEQIAVNFGA